MNIDSHFSDTFHRSNLFAGIAIKERDDILSQGHHIFFKSGEILFREDNPALRCYFVLDGLIKLSKLHEQGRRAIIYYINPGELIAAISVFKEKDYPVTAKAVNDAALISWNREIMYKLMLKYPLLVINMLQTTIDSKNKLQTRYLELHAELVKQRIARALLRIMRQSSQKTTEGILITFKLSRQELADYTGTTLYTVSRTLSVWGKNGWVKSGRERIIITNPHALVSFAEKG